MPSPTPRHPDRVAPALAAALPLLDLGDRPADRRADPNVHPIARYRLEKRARGLSVTPARRIDAPLDEATLADCAERLAVETGYTRPAVRNNAEAKAALAERQDRAGAAPPPAPEPPAPEPPAAAPQPAPALLATPKTRHCGRCGVPWTWPIAGTRLSDLCHGCVSPRVRHRRRTMLLEAGVAFPDLPLPLVPIHPADRAERDTRAAERTVAATNIVARVLDGLVRLPTAAALVIAIGAGSLSACTGERIAGPRATPDVACPPLVVSDSVKNDARAFAAADSAHQAACGRRIP